VGLDQAAIEGLGAMILAGGVGQLAVGDLRTCEVAGLAWSGNPAHSRSLAAALERAAQGLEDYLVVRASAGQPVAKMRVDHASEDDTGVFSQLVTMSPLQGLASPRCSSAPASSASVPGARPSPRSASKTTTRGHAASTSGSDTRRSPPARVVGHRRR
jgi:hypothetical protein